MLGRRPSGGGCGLGPSTSIRRTSPAFEPPRQQPLAAAGPSLSKEGSHSSLRVPPAALLKIVEVNQCNGKRAIRSGYQASYLESGRIKTQSTPACSDRRKLFARGHFLELGSENDRFGNIFHRFAHSPALLLNPLVSILF